MTTSLLLSTAGVIGTAVQFVPVRTAWLVSLVLRLNEVADPYAESFLVTIGKRMMNVVPFAVSVSKVREPPCFWVTV